MLTLVGIVDEMKTKEERIQKEVEFHNERERFRKDNPEEFEKRYSNKKWYTVTHKSRSYVEKLMDEMQGKEVLDYCCGLGGSSIKMAKRGAIVTGIDISDESVNTAKERAKLEGLSKTTNFVVGDAENTPFPDNSFDVVYCCGVLHHLDIDAALSEISRVLKPDGYVIGIEALSHNPVFMAYRRKTAGKLRTEYETEHILSVPTIKKGYKYFDEIEIKYYHLLELLATPFRKTIAFKPILAILGVLDSIILSIPLVRILAWQGIFIYRNKK